MDNISETGFWHDLNHHVFDYELANSLARFLYGSTVVDLGCGTGAYVRALRSHGINCDGYDGNPITPFPCHVLDLSNYVNLGTVYDWVISLEVGEHIPAKFESTFIDNIHRHNSKGVILSWAVVGQGGRGHFNERDNSYIKGIFANLGYINDITSECMLRCDSTCSWFRNTIMVFTK